MKQIRKSINVLSLAIMNFLIFTIPVHATTPDADTLWFNVWDFIATWIGRVGAVIAFIGAIQFAMGWKNDDADAKSRGVNFFSVGVIIIALTQSLHLFGITRP